MPLVFPLPRVIAHRGESGLAPENTLAAFELAANNGATWVELDANISADSVPYVHHDDSIERCTTGKGYLVQQPASVLDSLDAGSWFDSAFCGEALPTLKAVIALLVRRKLGLNLEIKHSSGLEEPTTVAICQLVARLWPEELPILLSSFSERALVVAARELPDIPRGLLVGAVPGDWQARMESLGCATIHCAAKHIDEPTAANIKASDTGLLCYTVNEIETARRLLDWGVDSVFTDFPSRLIPALEA